MSFLLKLTEWHSAFGRLLDKLQPFALLRRANLCREDFHLVGLAETDGLGPNR